MSLTQALYDMAKILGDEMTAGDVGPQFSCNEVEPIVRVLALAGHRGAAINFLFGHASGDEEIEEDRHAGLTQEQCAEYVDSLSV